MSRRQVIVACVVIFNVLMIVAFIFSNIYVWDFLDTQMKVGGRLENGYWMIPFVQVTGLQVTVGFSAWTVNGVPIPIAPPISVPNYPFIVFWVSIMGNLILVAFALYYWRTETSMKRHGDKESEI
jgi:hypothetical protein